MMNQLETAGKLTSATKYFAMALYSDDGNDDVASTS